MTATFLTLSDSLLAGGARRPRPLRRLAMAATAGVMALSLMMASSLPARADSRSDNLARVLISAIAIGAVIHSVDKSKKRRAQEEARRNPPLPQPEPLPAHARPGSRLPQACAIEIAGRHRSATVYPARCLRREGIEAHLPRRCGFEARIFGRVDRVYAEDCLLESGFRLGRAEWRDEGPRHGHGSGRDHWGRDGRGEQGYGRDRWLNGRD